MISIYERNDTIPISSRRIGSWQVSISRCLLPPEDLANRYDIIAADWQHTAQRYQLVKAYQPPLFASGAPDTLAGISGETQVLDCGVGLVSRLEQHSILGQTASLITFFNKATWVWTFREINQQT